MKYQIFHKKDTIDFIKIGKDTNYSKPTILFCQGSLPIPLVIKYEHGDYISFLSNFDYQKYLSKYNMIIISHPHTPVIAHKDILTDDHIYVPDIKNSMILCPKYEEDNYLENYVRRANAVIKYLRKQKWVDKSRIIVMGHSQGANVAAEIAACNHNIAGIGYFSGNIMGRFAELILKERYKSINEKQSSITITQTIDSFMHVWKEMCNGGRNSWGDPARTWLSFSNLQYENLAKTRIPLYVTYGNKDIGASYCKLLPIYCELNNKKNYVIREFDDRGHNFERISNEGKPNHDDMAWETAFSEFIDWCNTLW